MSVRDSDLSADPLCVCGHYSSEHQADDPRACISRELAGVPSGVPTCPCWRFSRFKSRDRR